MVIRHRILNCYFLIEQIFPLSPPHILSNAFSNQMVITQPLQGHCQSLQENENAENAQLYIM